MRLYQGLVKIIQNINIEIFLWSSPFKTCCKTSRGQQYTNFELIHSQFYIIVCRVLLLIQVFFHNIFFFLRKRLYLKDYTFTFSALERARKRSQKLNSHTSVYKLCHKNGLFFQIKIWFQNRRARERREHGKVGQSPPPRQQPGGPVKSAFTPLPLTRSQDDREDSTSTASETVSRSPCQVTLIHASVPLKANGLR